MGSEGYLINQFIAQQTNKREDGWGGSFENRIRFAVETVPRATRATGPNFIIIFRLSMLDLVEGGSTWDEIVTLAKAVEAAGATIINTGIGWHEARIPTIATMVPRAAFVWVTKRLMGEVGIPLVTTNRINTPEVAEEVLASARRHGLDGPPLPRRRRLRQQGGGRPCRRDQHLHRLQPGLSGRHLRGPADFLPGQPARLPRNRTDDREDRAPKRIAVVGAGPAGMACALTAAAERGHWVTLFDAAPEIGGQFNIAPHSRQGGVQRNAALLRSQLDTAGVTLELGRTCTAPNWPRPVSSTSFSPPASCRGGQPATGHRTREGDLLRRPDRRLSQSAGKRVAIIGAGGIGFDVAEFLTHTDDDQDELERFQTSGESTRNYANRGGLKPPTRATGQRQVWLLQRKAAKVGDGLAKTTGWIRRTLLKKRGVQMLSGVTYERIDDAGLHIVVDGQPQCLPVDT
jgi:2,4-dienoyl-CoA reductase (NADPH2)